MLIDLHAHTARLSYDSQLSPDELVEAAKAAGLDGICLTEHDFAWEPSEIERLSRRHRFLVLPGMEVNTAHGHVLAYGLERYVFGMDRVEVLARLAREAGAVLVAAHPYRRQVPWEPGRDGAWEEALGRALANPCYPHVCALEAFNGRGREHENRFSQELSQRLGLPTVAGSDAHTLADVGSCATEFLVPVRELGDLIAALRQGLFRPVILRARTV
ncbi:MAG TPA: PHP domain-containing protein [Dehalococcoidia bacterium]|nr:PHP domain-containing protein [Dehalococcoidia bacterium]